jgi:hypothetical protein
LLGKVVEIAIGFAIEIENNCNTSLFDPDPDSDFDFDKIILTAITAYVNDIDS